MRRRLRRETLELERALFEDNPDVQVIAISNLVARDIGEHVGSTGHRLRDIANGFDSVALEPDAHLVLVGKPSRERLARHPRVHVVGPVTERRECLFAADLSALPTRYDPFSNDCVEAAGEVVPVPRRLNAWRDVLTLWLRACGEALSIARALDAGYRSACARGASTSATSSSAASATCLFRADSWTTSDGEVRESPCLAGRVRSLRSELPHYSYQAHAERRRGGPVRAAVAAGWRFARGFVLRQGLREGCTGAWIAWSNAAQVYGKYRALACLERVRN